MSIKTKKTIKSVISYFFLSLVTLLVLFPFFVLLSRSVMTDGEVSSLPVKIFPTKISFNAYLTALDASLLKYTGNTLIVVVTNCILTPIAASFVGYGFAKLKFWGKEFWFFVALCTTMLPSIVTQIPLYVIYSKIQWLGTLLPLIVPCIFGGGVLNVFLIRQYMRGIPDSIMEAATIDGANWFQFYWRFMIPLSRPVIVLVAVQTFMTVWSDFMGPLIYLNNEKQYTLAVGIYNKFMSDSGGEFLPNLRMAIGVLMVIPPSILFLFFQKELIEGVALSGMKL